MMRSSFERAAALCLLLAFCVCALPSTAWAQAMPMIPAPTIAPTDTLSGLLVRGHAESNVAPDIAYVTVSVVNQSRDSTIAARENAQRSQAVLDALKGAGVAAKDIQTQSYVVEPQYDWNHNPPTLTGYQATNSVRVTIHNLTKIGEIIDAAVKAGANSVGDIAFDLADRRRVEGETLVAAITNARAKADLMAGAAGVSLGPLLRLSEETTPTVQPIFARAMVATAMAPATPTPISPQQISVTADVTAVYSIAPAH